MVILFLVFSAAALAFILFGIFKLAEAKFGSDMKRMNENIRQELEGTLWVMDDGSVVKFKDVKHGGATFIVETDEGEKEMDADALMRFDMSASPIQEVT